MSSSSLRPNPNDPGRGTMIAAVTWIFTIIAAICVGLWILMRSRKHMRWGAELWLMVIALLARVAFQISITVELAHGLGKHDIDLTPAQLKLINKLNWIALPFAVLTSTLARISITILLIRLFGVYRWFKYFLISLTTFMGIVGAIFIVITFTQITPIQALWDESVKPTSIMNPKVFLYSGYFYQSLYTFSDITYALFPVIIIWRLHKPLRARIGLMLLMCLSLFTMATSILKTYYVAAIANAGSDATDVQYTASWQVLFGVLEQDFVIIMGCIPSIHVLVAAEVNRLLSATASLIKSRTRSTEARGSVSEQSRNNSGSDAKTEKKPRRRIDPTITEELANPGLSKFEPEEQDISHIEGGEKGSNAPITVRYDEEGYR